MSNYSEMVERATYRWLQQTYMTEPKGENKEMKFSQVFTDYKNFMKKDRLSKADLKILIKAFYGTGIAFRGEDIIENLVFKTPDAPVPYVPRDAGLKAYDLRLESFLHDHDPGTHGFTAKDFADYKRESIQGGARKVVFSKVLLDDALTYLDSQDFVVKKGNYYFTT